MSELQSKRCTGCGEVKRLTEYHRDARRKDGRVSQCKPCARAQSRAYAAEHREERAAYNAAYYARPEAKAEQAAYRARPEVRAKRAALNARPENKAKRAAYSASPEGKAKRTAYLARPDVKVNQTTYYAAYNARPERKAKQAARAATPEYKAKAAAHRATPEAKAKQAAYNAGYYHTERGRAVILAREARRRVLPNVSDLSADTIKQIQDAAGGICCYCGKPFDPEAGHIDHVLPVSKGGTNARTNLVCCCAPCNMSKHDKTPEEWLQQPAAREFRRVQLAMEVMRVDN